MDDDIVKIPLAGDDLQKDRIDHEDQKRHGAIDDRDAHEAPRDEPAGSPELLIQIKGRGIADDNRRRRRLADQDRDAERERQEMRQMPPLAPDHDDAVMDQKKRHDQQHDQSCGDQKEQRAAHIVPEEAEHKGHRAEQREKQQVAVAVAAAVLVKCISEERPEADCRKQKNYLIHRSAFLFRRKSKIKFSISHAAPCGKTDAPTRYLFL